MHELSIASTIVECVLDWAESQDAGKVVRVRLAVGEFTCVQADQLKFCYESIIGETPLEDSTLEIEPVPARVRCAKCAYEGPPKYWTDSLADAPVATLQCPVCGAAAEAAQGHECAIKTIQYVSRPEAST